MFIPNGFAQANFRYVGPGVPFGAEWTIGIDVDQYAGTPSTLAGELAADYIAQSFQSIMAVGVDLSSVLVKYGPNATGATAEAFATEAGTVASGASPNVAYLVSKLTAQGGRRGRGRLYLPGVTEAGINNSGTVLAATVTNIQTAFTAMHALAIADSRPYVLLHSSTEHFPDLITSFVAQSIGATQRRRMRR